MIELVDTPPMRPAADVVHVPNAARNAPASTKGLCLACFGSGYVHRLKEGKWGVCYSVEGTDAHGQEIARLVRCECRALGFHK